MNLNKLGFDRWFLEQTESEPLPGAQIARVTAVNKESFHVRNNERDIFAEMSGKMLFNVESSEDFPTVGDWVYVQFFNGDSFAIIHEILPRKSLLKRKAAGKKTEYQLIAANIDTAFIMQSFGPDYNLRRMERYLVMVNEGNIQPVVLLSKSDLLPEDERNRRIADIKALMPNIQVVQFSNINHEGIDSLKALLVPGNTFCLLGSSGTGKTTLLNNLTDQFKFETHEVREKDGKGRHTTTRRQLVCLENDAMIIDTPGMRELGNITVSTGIDETFSEITELSKQCAFKDCSHTTESDCAILQALEEGIISDERYQNFVKMNKEAAYNEMSYIEKRRKDKHFGKHCKTVMKDKVKKR